MPDFFAALRWLGKQNRVIRAAATSLRGAV